MTELSFLIELLLEHRLTATTKTAIKERIKGLEERQSKNWDFPVAKNYAELHTNSLTKSSAQAPSTQAKLDKEPLPTIITYAGEVPPTGVPTPAATAALQHRAELMAAAAGGVNLGTVSTGKGLQGKRKF